MAPPLGVASLRPCALGSPPTPHARLQTCTPGHTLPRCASIVPWTCASPSRFLQRTSVTAKERGGALVTEFNPADLQGSKVVLSGQTMTEHVTPPEELWANLEYFLKKVSG